MCGRLILTLFLALPCGAECLGIPELRGGNIRVSAFDITGENIPSISVELLDFSNKILRDTRNGRLSKVKYGNYKLRVSAAGFRSVIRELHMYQPDLAARVRLDVSLECGPIYASLIGKLAPVQAGRALWVKVFPLLGAGEVAEAPVTKDGAFLAAGLDAGQYLLVVVDGESAIHTQVLTIAGDTRVAIDLRPEH
jgi:hypothetical protein